MKKQTKIANNAKKNFYWLVGDRFFCHHRCDNIIKSINANNDWEIKKIDDEVDADKFCACLSSDNLFGEASTIFVFKSQVPEPAKTFRFVLQLPTNKVLICINEKINKKSTLFKKLKDKTCLEEYPSVCEDGKTHYNLIGQVKKNIKEATKWDGSDDVLDEILEMANYDYGVSINEIEKLRVYSHNNLKALSKEDALNVSINDYLLDINKLLRFVKEKNFAGTFKIIQNAVQTESIDNIHQQILGALSDDYSFSLACRMAMDGGLKYPDQIARSVASFYIKKGSLVSEDYIKSRYYYYSKFLPYMKSGKLAHGLVLIESAMRLCIFGCFPKRTIILSLLFDLIS